MYATKLAVVLVLPYYETGGIDKPEIMEDRMGVTQPYLAAGLTRGDVIRAHARRFLATRCSDMLVTCVSRVQAEAFRCPAAGAYVA